jgi:hypothetical protein
MVEAPAPAPTPKRAGQTVHGNSAQARTETAIREHSVLLQAENDQRVAVERKWRWGFADIANRDRQDRGVLHSAAKSAPTKTSSPAKGDAAPQQSRFGNLFSFVSSVIEELEHHARASVEAEAQNGFEEFGRAAMAVAGAEGEVVELAGAEVLPLSLAAREHPHGDVPRIIAMGRQVGLAWPAKRNKPRAAEIKPRPSPRGRELESQETAERSAIERTWKTRLAFASKAFAEAKRVAIDSEKRRLTAAARVQPDAETKQLLIDAAAALTVLTPATASALLALERYESAARDELEEGFLRTSFAHALRRKGAMLGVASPSHPSRVVKAVTPGARRPPRLAPLVVRSVTTTPPPPATKGSMLDGEERHLESPQQSPPQDSPIVARQPPREIGRLLREEETARAALRAQVLEWQNRTAMRLLAPPRRAKRDASRRAVDAEKTAAEATLPATATPPPVLRLHGTVSAELGELVEDWEASGRAEITADWIDSWKALAVKESVWRGGIASLRRPAEMRFTRRIVRSEMRGPKRPTFSKPQDPPAI